MSSALTMRAILNRVQSSLYFLFHWLRALHVQQFFFRLRFITTFHRLSFSFWFSYPESYSFRNSLSLISRNTLLNTLNRIIRYYYKWFFSLCDLFALISFSVFFRFEAKKKSIPTLTVLTTVSIQHHFLLMPIVKCVRVSVHEYYIVWQSSIQKMKRKKAEPIQCSS